MGSNSGSVPTCADTEGESRELFSYVAGEPTRRRRAGGETLTAGLFGEISVDIGG